MSACYSVNSLMKHLRKANIEIGGSAQKRQLIISGYFHGYKGYRYSKEPGSIIPYTHFCQIQAVIDYDIRIKSALYSPLMQLETALKSISTESIIKIAKTDSFHILFDKFMSKAGHKNPQSYYQRKLKLRDDIYATLTNAYCCNKNKIVKHYYNKDEYVPIWALIEVLTLGQFGVFVEMLDPCIRIDISDYIRIEKKYNTNGTLLPTIIFIVQELRNSVAHNNVVFDSRYRGDRRVDNTLKDCLHAETKVSNITFDSIVDDIVLITYLLKKLCFKKTVIYSMLRCIKAAVDDLYRQLPTNIFMKIVPSDTSKKISQLVNYVRR